MKYIKNISLIFLITVFLILPCSAHGGKTDGDGGHYNRDTGEYHYHHGYPAHQHTNGECPYNFKNNEDSNNSYNNSITEKTTKASTTKIESTTQKTDKTLSTEEKRELTLNIIKYSIAAIFSVPFIVPPCISCINKIKERKENKKLNNNNFDYSNTDTHYDSTNISKSIPSITDDVYKDLVICYQTPKDDLKTNHLLNTDSNKSTKIHFLNCENLSALQLRRKAFSHIKQLNEAHNTLELLLDRIHKLNISNADCIKISNDIQIQYPKFENIDELSDIIYNHFCAYEIIEKPFNNTKDIQKYNNLLDMIDHLVFLAYEKDRSTYAIFFPYDIFESLISIFYKEMINKAKNESTVKFLCEKYIKLLSKATIEFHDINLQYLQEKY